MPPRSPFAEPLDFSDDLLALENDLRHKSENEKRCMRPRRLSESVSSINSCEFSSGRTSGNDRLKKIRSDIYDGKFGIKPSIDQRDIIEAILGVSLPIIYGKELPYNIDRLLYENAHWRDSKAMVAIVASRREGKTTAVSLAVSSLALNIDNVVAPIFSTGRRASRNILTLVFKLLLSYHHGRCDGGGGAHPRPATRPHLATRTHDRRPGVPARV